MSEQPSEIEHEVRDYVRSEVKSGFGTRDEIVTNTTEYFEDDFPDLDPFLIAHVVDEELTRHHEEQANWDGPTDCDRLDHAFAHLELQGIVARQDFACCGNCGVAEIGDEATPETSQGYVFYHMQDTQHAVDGGGLCFNYGVFHGGEADAIAVGWKLFEALCHAGLKPEWDGNLQKRVSLPMTWRKRRDLEE